MVAKVILIKEKPPENMLETGEIVLDVPSFLPEVKASHRKASGKQITSIWHLREIVGLITEKYDKDLLAFVRIPYANYEGIAFENDEDISAIVTKILDKHAPELLTKALDYNVKNRPPSTKVIYFTGPESYLPVFFANGVALE